MQSIMHASDFTSYGNVFAECESLAFQALTFIMQVMPI